MIAAFWRRLGLFALPIIAYVGFIAAVDPFGRLGVSNLIAPAAKAIVAPTENGALWTVIRLDRTRATNILIGDSKMRRLDTVEIRRVSGMDYANVAMDGASASDRIDLFWRAVERRPLQNVVISLSLESFNRGTNRDLIKAAEAAESNLLLYFSSRDVLAAAVTLAVARVRGREPERPRPLMSPDQFWQYQVDYGARRNFQGFQFDEDAFAEYRRIALYCASHSIRLRFVILPTHADIHQRIMEFGLEREWRTLPARLRTLAETIDFDSDSAMTADRVAFSDPFHMAPSTASRVVATLFAR